MNFLAREKSIKVLGGLVDGQSERAIERGCGVNRSTISRIALVCGMRAQYLHDQYAHDLQCSNIQIDEIWSFIQKKQKRVTPEDAVELGEAYTYVAIDVATRLAISFHVGKRNQENTNVFVNDLRRRLVVVPTITSDGFGPYIAAIGGNFGKWVDYAQTIKHYTGRGKRHPVDSKFEPPRDPFITKKTIFGAPDLDQASTAYVERNNATMRHHIGRMRRLSFAFSKKLDHHRAAVALNYVHYNLCHVVKTLRVTPAVSAGLTDHVWALDEFFDKLMAVDVVDAPLLQPLQPRPPTTTARAIPSGQFLRVVPARAPKSNTPQPTPKQLPLPWDPQGTS